MKNQLNIGERIKENRPKWKEDLKRMNEDSLLFKVLDCKCRGR
jgi:hypothetical protein